MHNQYSITTKAGSLRVSDSGGTGMPVLMIHGTASTRLAFRRQFDSELAQRFRLVAPDLPGHGESANAINPAYDYTISGYMQVMSELIEQLGLRSIVVFGWSLGGHIGIELLQHPAVEGLMISGAPPVGKGPGKFLAVRPSLDMFLAAKTQFSERDVRRFDELCFPHGSDPALLDALRRADGSARRILIKSVLDGDGSDQRRAVIESSVPVAIVSGADEPFTRLGYLDGLRFPMLWKGAAQVLEGAGHAPFWDRPAVFNRLLGQFVEAVAAAGSGRMARSA